MTLGRCGAYIDYRPGQMIRHFKHIAASEGRIHFAGEHTSKMYASMEGAMESGKRVVREIYAKHGLNFESPTPLFHCSLKMA